MICMKQIDADTLLLHIDLATFVLPHLIMCEIAGLFHVVD
jgi:hypothetical protein